MLESKKTVPKRVRVKRTDGSGEVVETVKKVQKKNSGDVPEIDDKIVVVTPTQLRNINTDKSVVIDLRLSCVLLFFLMVGRRQSL